MLRYLARRWFLLLIMLGLYLAVKYPQASDRCLSLVQTRHIAAAVLLLMSLGLPTERLWSAVRRPWPALVALAVSYGVGPVVAWLAGTLLLPLDYRAGLIVAGSVPCTLASATIWTRLAGGNEAIALFVTMLSNTLVFIFTASWLALLTGQQVSFDVGDMVLGLLLYVVAPIAIGQVMHNIGPIGKLAERGKRVISVLCRILILLIIVKSAVLARTGLTANTTSWSVENLCRVAVVCIGVHLLLLGLGYALSLRLFARSDAIAVAFACSQKTLPVGAYLIADYYGAFPLAIVPLLFFHVGQLLVDTYIAEHLFYRTPEAERPPGDFDDAMTG